MARAARQRRILPDSSWVGGETVSRRRNAPPARATGGSRPSVRSSDTTMTAELTQEMCADGQDGVEGGRVLWKTRRCGPPRRAPRRPSGSSSSLRGIPTTPSALRRRQDPARAAAVALSRARLPDESRHRHPAGDRPTRWRPSEERPSTATDPEVSYLEYRSG